MDMYNLSTQCSEENIFLQLGVAIDSTYVVLTYISKTEQSSSAFSIVCQKRNSM
jgi:hypothetical protein